MTLTDAQANILRAMREGAELWTWYGASTKRQWTSIGKGLDSRNINLRSVMSLVRAGYLASKHEGYSMTGRTTYTLTPSGLTALAAWEAGREGA